MVSLSVFAGDDTFPFTIDAEMTGHFELAGTPDEKQFDMLKNVNCPAIMLPYLREFISDLTRRAGLSPLYIPPFNFVAAYKNRS